ncbi:MAG: hypothetical protein BWX83_00002 [Candidatus Cloacimonetes bacterium ADurb.Bin117]|mgnify:CR=1 FL=1|nr:MAG: hypothetical protein BWX83_00002 [Candidatus Cloacimonetes bacterium ADurb.Bin117]
MLAISKSSGIKALTLVMLIAGIWVSSAENAMTPYLEKVSEFPDCHVILRLYNRDVVSCFDIREIITLLKVKDSQKTEQINNKLTELKKARKPYFEKTIYSMSQLSFCRYNLKTGGIQTQIPYPVDVLGKKLSKLFSVCIDHPIVFNGVSLISLPTCNLSMELFSYGNTSHVLDPKKVSEQEATGLEESWLYSYGIITPSNNSSIFCHDYCDGLQSEVYRAGRITKEAPVIGTFKLIIHDPETNRIILVKDFKPTTKEEYL